MSSFPQLALEGETQIESGQWTSKLLDYDLIVHVEKMIPRSLEIPHRDTFVIECANLIIIF